MIAICGGYHEDTGSEDDGFDLCVGEDGRDGCEIGG